MLLAQQSGSWRRLVPGRRRAAAKTVGGRAGGRAGVRVSLLGVTRGTCRNRCFVLPASHFVLATATTTAASVAACGDCSSGDGRHGAGTPRALELAVVLFGVVRVTCDSWGCFTAPCLRPRVARRPKKTCCAEPKTSAYANAREMRDFSAA